MGALSCRSEIHFQCYAVTFAILEKQMYIIYTLWTITLLACRTPLKEKVNFLQDLSQELSELRTNMSLTLYHIGSIISSRLAV